MMRKRLWIISVLILLLAFLTIGNCNAKYVFEDSAGAFYLEIIP